MKDGTQHLRQQLINKLDKIAIDSAEKDKLIKILSNPRLSTSHYELIKQHIIRLNSPCCPECGYQLLGYKKIGKKALR